MAAATATTVIGAARIMVAAAAVIAAASAATAAAVADIAAFIVVIIAGVADRIAAGICYKIREVNVVPIGTTVVVAAAAGTAAGVAGIRLIGVTGHNDSSIKNVAEALLPRHSMPIFPFVSQKAVKDNGVIQIDQLLLGRISDQILQIRCLDGRHRHVLHLIPFVFLFFPHSFHPAVIVGISSNFMHAVKKLWSNDI